MRSGVRGLWNLIYENLSKAEKNSILGFFFFLGFCLGIIFTSLALYSQGQILWCVSLTAAEITDIFKGFKKIIDK